MKKLSEFLKKDSPAISEGFGIDIETKTLKNQNFREVLYTGKHLQLVVMSIPAGGDIGAETHGEGDQFIRVESGTARFEIDKTVYTGSAGFSVVIDQGSLHNVINAGKEKLSLYMLYSWPNHKDGHVDVVKPTK